MAFYHNIKKETELEKNEKIDDEELEIEKSIEEELKEDVQKPRETKNSFEEKAKKIKLGLKRTESGIKNMDHLIEGGFITHNIHLIDGSYGTGKTIFGCELLYRGITDYNENGLYISFSETKKDFYRNMKVLGFDFEKLEQEKKFIFIDFAPEEVEKILLAGGGLILDSIDEIKAKRILIDPITPLTLLHTEELAKRESIDAVFKTIKKWDVTLFLIGEKNKEDLFLYHKVDSIIELNLEKNHNSIKRTIEIVKMRATKHSETINLFQITENGIYIMKRN